MIEFLHGVSAHLDKWSGLMIMVIMVADICSSVILHIEFFYDKHVIEKKWKRYKRKKNQVIVRVDKEGQASVVDKPNDVEVIIHDE